MNGMKIVEDMFRFADCGKLLEIFESIQKKPVNGLFVYYLLFPLNTLTNATTITLMNLGNLIVINLIFLPPCH